MASLPLPGNGAEPPGGRSNPAPRSFFRQDRPPRGRRRRREGPLPERGALVHHPRHHRGPVLRDGGGTLVHGPRHHQQLPPIRGSRRRRREQHGAGRGRDRPPRLPSRRIRQLRERAVGPFRRARPIQPRVLAGKAAQHAVRRHRHPAPGRLRVHGLGLGHDVRVQPHQGGRASSAPVSQPRRIRLRRLLHRMRPLPGRGQPCPDDRVGGRLRGPVPRPVPEQQLRHQLSVRDPPECRLPRRERGGLGELREPGSGNRRLRRGGRARGGSRPRKRLPRAPVLRRPRHLLPGHRHTPGRRAVLRPGEGLGGVRLRRQRLLRATRRCARWWTASR